MGLDQSLIKRKRGRGKPIREEVAYWVTGRVDVRERRRKENDVDTESHRRN